MNPGNAIKQSGIGSPVFFQKNDCFNHIGNAGGLIAVSFLRRGTGTIRGPERKYMVAAPSLLVVSKMAETRFEPGRGFEADTIYFQPAFFTGLGNLHNMHDTKKISEAYSHQAVHDKFSPAGEFVRLFPLEGLMQKDCELFFEKISGIAGFRMSADASYRLKAVLISFLVYLNCIFGKKNGEGSFAVSRDEKKVQDIIMYLFSHYQEELTVDSIAREFATNRTTLNIIFNRYAGCTVIRYLRNIRVNLAARLLAETSLNISEIGFEVGFQDISNFGKVFRQKFGCTPSAFRSRSRRAGHKAQHKPVPGKCLHTGSGIAV